MTRKKKVSIPEESRIRLLRIIDDFRKSSDKVYAFEPELTKAERHWAHIMCRKKGLKSKSDGKGNERRLSVSKKEKSAKDKYLKFSQESMPNLRDLSFTFSEESKHVLQDLFTRHPPSEQEMIKKMENKLIKNHVRRKGDDFFLRPLMEKEQILEKVASLAAGVENYAGLRQIHEKTSKLPITKFKDIITSTIESNQVVLISGETGCGKTTQVPQFILDHMWGKGEMCKIVCTQPRRISAMSVSERIAFERAEVLGDTIGYKVRLESSGGRNSSIVFCTNGVMLKILVSKGNNGVISRDGVSGITHIIVDEIHERDRFADLMLAILRDMLPSYPHLRLVLMSATIDAERFSEYFGGCPIIQVPGFTYPVKSFYLEDVLTLLNLKSKKQAIAEEKDLLNEYLSTRKSEEIDIALIENLLITICTDTETGAILVFLPGWDDICNTRERLVARFFKDQKKFLILSLHSMVPSDEQKKVFERPPKGCRKIVLSTNIAETSVTIDDVVYVIDSGRAKEQNYDPFNNVSTLNTSWISKASAKQREGRAGRCQPGVCYHIYPRDHADSLINFQIPEIKRIPIEELCLQVKILDPDCKLDEFLQKTLDPPISETIQNAVKILQDIGALSSDEKLTDLGMKIGSLPVHPQMSKMLIIAILTNCLDPALTLAVASNYKDVFTLPILHGKSKRKEVAAAKSELSALYGGYSDQLATVVAFECYKVAKKNGKISQFCSKYNVSRGTMKMLFNMREQLNSELERIGFLPRNKSFCNLNSYDLGVIRAVLVAGQYPMVGKLIPKNGGFRSTFVQTVDNKVRLHTHSALQVLNLKDNQDQPLVVHDGVVNLDSGLIIRNCSLIAPLPLLLLATEIIVVPTKEKEKRSGKVEDVVPTKEKGSEEEDDVMSAPDKTVNVVVDRWLSFRSTAIDAAQIYWLRERLSNAIAQKISSPHSNLSKLLTDSLQAITATLSIDGKLKVPPPVRTQNSEPTPEENANEPAPKKIEKVDCPSQNSSDGAITATVSIDGTLRVSPMRTQKSEPTPEENANEPAPKKMKKLDCPSQNSSNGEKLEPTPKENANQPAPKKMKKVDCPSQNSSDGGLWDPLRIPDGDFSNAVVCPAGMFEGYQIIPARDKNVIHSPVETANVSQIPNGGAEFPSENLESSVAGSLKRRRDDES